MRGRGIAAALAAAAMLAAAVPWLLGLHAEHIYRQPLNDLADRGYRLIQDEYRRGWLDARALVVIAPPADPSAASGAAPAMLQVASRIIHGPRPARPLALARIESRVTVVGAPRALPPLLIDATVGPAGNIGATLTTPDLTYAGSAGALQLLGADGRIEVRRGGRDWHGEGGIARIEALAGDGRALVLSGLGWRLALRHADAPLPDIEAELTLAGLKLAGVPQAPPLAASDLRVSAALRVSDTRAGLTAAATLAELNINRQPFAPSELRLDLDGLDAAALATLRAELGALGTQQLPASVRGLALGTLAVRALPGVLAGEPRLALSPLRLMTPQGPITASLALRLAGEVPANPAAPLAWLGRLAGEARAAAPRELLLHLMAQDQARRARAELAQRGEPAEVLPPALAAEVDAAAEASLAALLRQRWLIAEQDRVGATAVLGDGLLTVNGKTLPIEAAPPP